MSMMDEFGEWSRQPRIQIQGERIGLKRTADAVKRKPSRSLPCAWFAGMSGRFPQVVHSSFFARKVRLSFKVCTFENFLPSGVFSMEVVISIPEKYYNSLAISFLTKILDMWFHPETRKMWFFPNRLFAVDYFDLLEFSDVRESSISSFSVFPKLFTL